MRAERAARPIVRATQRGEAERILSLPANLLGIEAQQRMRSRLLDVLTGLERAAAHRLHQYAPAAPQWRLAPPVERRR